MTLLHKPKRKYPLHDYQVDAVQKFFEEIEEQDRVMLVLPTGAGKTMTAGEIIFRFVEQGKRVLVLAHTQKLVTQFAKSIEDNYGIWTTIEMGTSRSEESPVVVATIQTMLNRIRKGHIDPGEFDLVVIDEAHRALSNSYQELAKAFDHAKFLGLTATPRRGDQKDLMKFFQSKAADVPLNEMIDRGFLAPITIKNIPVQIELVASKKTGDYTEQDCAHAIEPYLDSIAKHYAAEGRGKCGLVFAPLRATSRVFVKMLAKHGIKAEHVDGEMGQDEVNATIERLERGDIDCISNSMLLTEGVDIRPVNILLSLRPTRSWPLYVQTIGRATRTFDPKKHGVPGTRWGPKDGALVLDPLWLCDQHSLLQRPSTLIASDDEEAEAIDRIIKEKQAKGGGGEGEADLMEARAQARAEREERLRQKLEAMAKRKARTINPLEFFTRLHLPDFAEYEPLNELEARPISFLSQKQREWLEKSKFDMESIKNMGQAKKILDALGNRAKERKATIGQIKYCQGLGMDEDAAWELSFEDASAYIEKNRPPQPWAKWKTKRS